MKTLCVTYGGGHAAMIAPIAKRLNLLGHETIILGLTTAETYLKNQGLNSIGFRHLLEPGDEEALRWGAFLAKNLDQSSSIPIEETIAYLGLSYQDLIDQLGRNKAEQLYAEKGRHAFLPVSILRRAISRFKPDIVLATNSPRAEQAAILAAGQLEIPSICINDLFALQEFQWLGKPGYANKICVLNDAVKAFLINKGRKPEDIEVTGNPAFDRLADNSLVKQGVLLRETKKWNDGKKNLLWASQPEPALHPFMPGKVGDPCLPRSIETVLRQLVRERTDLRLIVRYHPSENISFVPDTNIEFSPISEDLGTLLYAVDGVAITCSTVGLEAALIGKPVFAVNSSIFTADTPYVEFGIAIGCPTPRELPNLICQWLDQHINIHPRITLDGNATNKILEIMESLLHEIRIRQI